LSSKASGKNSRSALARWPASESFGAAAVAPVAIPANRSCDAAREQHAGTGEDADPDRSDERDAD
jgi:hypothetical protein